MTRGLIWMAAAAVAWMDPSPHRTRFVAVDRDVRLEVLDWGGSGRAVVLLAGSGNTAHVFDEFALKVKRFAHVYGITRRGYGSSSQPASGYDDQRLADDVLAVLKELRLRRPVLVGHSMAGGELTTLGNQHSEMLGGLVYLDALGDPRDWPGSDPAYRAIVAEAAAGSSSSAGSRGRGSADICRIPGAATAHGQVCICGIGAAKCLCDEFRRHNGEA